MMDAVAEEHPLRISLELGEFPACTVTVVVLKDILKDLANLEIILVVLHPDDVTAIFRRFGKINTPKVFLDTIFPISKFVS